MVNLHDTNGADWEEVAKSYRQLTVCVNVRPINVMLERANALKPFTEATGIHDNGCGPGPVISRIISDYGTQIPTSCTLSCSDFSQGMVDQVKRVQAEEVEANSASPWARVNCTLLNAMDLQGIADESMTHVTAGWVYFMTPDPKKCLGESRRVLKAGGVLALSSWKGSQWMDLMKLALKVRPQSEFPTIPEAWASTVGVQAQLEEAGFQNVEAYEVPVQMTAATHAGVADLLMTKMPPIVALLKHFSSSEQEEYRRLIVESAEEMSPETPIVLNGVAIVAIGRK